MILSIKNQGRPPREAWGLQRDPRLQAMWVGSPNSPRRLRQPQPRLPGLPQPGRLPSPAPPTQRWTPATRSTAPAQGNARAPLPQERPSRRGWNTGPHRFELDLPSCLASDCTEDEVFAAWRDYSAPGAPRAVDGTRRVMLWGRNPILQTVDPRTRTITNRTVPGHAFHPGTVTIRTRTRNGVVGAQVVGEGDGGSRWQNYLVGPTLFAGSGMLVRSRTNPDPWPVVP